MPAALGLLAATLVFASPGAPTVEIAAGDAVAVRNVVLTKTDGGWRLSSFVCRRLAGAGGWPTRSLVRSLDDEGRVLATSWRPMPPLSGPHARFGCRPMTFRLDAPSNGRVVIVFE